jgi:hypothetical protein
VRIFSCSEEAALKRHALRIAFILAGLAFQVSAPHLRAQEDPGAAGVSVVVNADNPIGDISMVSLRKVVLGETTSWKNHTSIVLILRPEGTRERNLVAHVVAQMSNSQFKQHWMGKVFRAEASAEPLTVTSKGLMLEYLGDRRGGISFIEAPAILPHIKVITVNGLKPGDLNYALR